MKFAFVAAWEVAFSVATMCRVLRVSRSGYYAWKERPAPARARMDAGLAIEIAVTHKRSRSTYGSPRIHADLRAQGTRVGKKRVERLMREQGIRAGRCTVHCGDVSQRGGSSTTPIAEARMRATIADARSNEQAWPPA